MPSLYHFHVNVFARPESFGAADGSKSQFIEPMNCTWEDTAAALEKLPRMIFEPDGSFVWSGDEEDRRWQIDGHLFDFSDRLHRLELHGQCPAAALDALLAAAGWPKQRLVFQLVHEGVALEETDFRCHLAGEDRF